MAASEDGKDVCQRIPYGGILEEVMYPSVLSGLSIFIVIGSWNNATVIRVSNILELQGKYKVIHGQISKIICMYAHNSWEVQGSQKRQREETGKGRRQKIMAEKHPIILCGINGA